jgi:hypothetical protein
MPRSASSAGYSDLGPYATTQQSLKRPLMCMPEPKTKSYAELHALVRPATGLASGRFPRDKGRSVQASATD